MYFGQATKDLLCMPRPASPPVVKLEERYVKEYGFPSTHAMASAGLPISVVVLSYSRYNINLPISICIAATFCLWVCCSRLYLGMHSLLDVREINFSRNKKIKLLFLKFINRLLLVFYIQY